MQQSTEVCVCARVWSQSRVMHCVPSLKELSVQITFTDTHTQPPGEGDEDISSVRYKGA